MPSTPESAAKVFGSRVFLVNISISQACPAKLALEPEQTRSSAVVDALKRNGGSLGKDGIPIFEVIGDNGKPIFSSAKARTRLSSVLDSLQDRFMVSQGNGRDWYVPESRIGDLDRAIASELAPVRDELLEQFATYYDDAHALFCDRLSDVLSVLKLKDWEPYYSTQFPSLEEIENNFSYCVERWEPMKTLTEVLESAEADAALKRSAEVLERQLKAIQDDAPRLQDEALGLLAAIATLFEESESRDAIAEKVTAKFERVDTLQSLWVGIFSSPNGLIEEIEDDLKSANRMMLPSDAMPDLREKWQVLPLPAFGDGVIAFTCWLHPEKRLQAQIQELQSKLEGELAPKARSRAEGKLKDLQEQLEAGRSISAIAQ